MPGINEKILKIPFQYTKKLTEEIKEDRSVINLGRGDAEFMTPQPIIDYLYRILCEKGIDDINEPVGKYTHYAPTKGLKSLKQAICGKYQKESNLELNPENVLVTNAGMNAISLSLLAITNPGDEILIPSPCYVAYDPISNYILDGRIGKRINLDEKNQFMLKMNDLYRATTKNTKALILTSPLNPTGTVYDRKSLEEIMRYGVENDIFIIHDENHEKEMYDNNKHYAIALFDKNRENSVLLNSFSRLGMGGWRLGWMIAPKKVIETASLIHSFTNMTCNTAVQEAGAFALDNYDTLGFREEFENYQKKRDYIVNELNSIDGIKCPEGLPQGTCYVFPNIRGFYEKHRDMIANSLKEPTQSISVATYKFLINKAKVGCIPGLAYGDNTDDYLRFSFSAKKEAIEEGMKRIKESIKWHT